MRWRLAAIGALAGAAGPQWSTAPWLGDLAEMRAAMDAKYANLDWLREDREVDIDALFARSRAELEQAGSDADARAVFDRLVRRIGDGHVALRWPEPKETAGGNPSPAGPCATLGFDPRQETPGIGPSLPGYAAVPGAGAEDAFPTGIVESGGRRVGIVRIAVFQPQGRPDYCTQALAALAIPADAPCDDACQDRILTHAYDRMTALFEARLRALKIAGASALIIDITRNGGGSEWAEAAARMATPRLLASERIAFIRGAHWARHWTELARTLRAATKTAGKADAARLEGWARQADAARIEAETPCAPGGACTRLGQAGTAAGLVGQASRSDFAGKPWAVHVFSPAQFPYREGAWAGPLIVLVDQETWSAAEEFAAILQDNAAAVIMGARTGGTGCGHTNGGTPTTLTHSGAVLALPDCARLRADGSNEVNGIVPDVLIGWRPSDGGARKARFVLDGLPSALARADALAR